MAGLDPNAPPVVPAWAKEHVGVETWTGQSLPLDKLCEAAKQLSPRSSLFDVEDRVHYRSPDGSTMEIDLTIPLLLLARDLQGLEESGRLTLGGA